MATQVLLTLKLRWKFCTLTFLYGAVLRWHHNKRPSLAVISSTEMSWMANLKMIVQIMPSVIFKLPSTISSAPIETSFTPFDAMKSRALLTLAICGSFSLGDGFKALTHDAITLWKRILPRSGFGRVSPEMTSSNSISFRPLRKSSSILSIAVPALRK